jgi:beta-propeller repeat-containing protein/CARDB protein
MPARCPLLVHLALLWAALAVLALPASVPSVQPAGPAAPPAARREAASALARLPLQFEANQGQAASQVRYLARGKGYQLALCPTEAVLSVSVPQRRRPRGTRRKGSQRGESLEALGAKTSCTYSPIHHSPLSHPGSASQTSHLKMRLVGGNAAPEVSGEAELPGKVHYYLGDDPTKWRTNVPTYGQVRYDQVYPGIDLVYYGQGQELEYDFIVAPGADPRSIALAFEGAESLRVDQHGELVLETPAGEVRQRKPIIYQEAAGVRTPVEGAYVLIEGGAQSAEREAPKPGTPRAPRPTLCDAGTRQPLVAFAVGEYDRSRPLVIDPILVFSTYLGGTESENFELATDVAVDGEDNLVVAGVTNALDFPATNSPGALTNGFVTKINAARDGFVFSLYLGGNDADAVFGLALGGSGNIFVTGRTRSTNFPLMRQNMVDQGGTDAFVTKFGPFGSVSYSTYLGGADDDTASDITVGANGNAHVVGFTLSPDFPTRNGFQTTLRTFGDAFVTSLLQVGLLNVTIDYSTYLGGSVIDTATAIAAVPTAAAETAVVITGQTTSMDFPVTPGVHQVSKDLGNDTFVARLRTVSSGAASLVYSTYLGGTGNDFGGDVDVDNSGNVYVAGTTVSAFNLIDDALASFDPTLGTGGGSDAYVVKLSADGSQMLYGGYLGGVFSDDGEAIDVDSTGVAWVTGDSNSPTAVASPSFPLVNPLPFATGLPSAPSAFVSAIRASGTALAFSTLLGGSGPDEALGIAVTGPTPVSLPGRPIFFLPPKTYVCGSTRSADFPTANPLQPMVGAEDAFVAQINNTVGAGLSGRWLRVIHPRHPRRFCPLAALLLVENPGIYDAPPTVARFYLSDDAVLGPGDTLLQEIKVATLPAGQTRRIPFAARLANCGKGKHLIVVWDATDQVPEPNELNNINVFGPLP